MGFVTAFLTLPTEPPTPVSFKMSGFCVGGVQEVQLPLLCNVPQQPAPGSRPGRQASELSKASAHVSPSALGSYQSYPFQESFGFASARAWCPLAMRQTEWSLG